ncbi:hypothetical protein ACWDR0_09400 [Streptomyces sp. NPDC003691]
MPIDPFAALNAMLRADAARAAADFAEKRARSQGKQQSADEGARSDEPEPRSESGPGTVLANRRDHGTP